MDALEFLREDHRAVLAMLDELERGRSQTAAPTNPDDLERRKRMVTELVMAESAHEAVEEQYFWPSVQHWLEQGKDLAQPALEQEQQAKSMLTELDKAEPGDSSFETLLDKIVHDAREHLAYEENEVWPAPREQVAARTLDQIGDKMATAKKMVPTRPHPHTRPGPAC